VQPGDAFVERAVRAFAAAAIAEAAHELNNRLATMRETVGLLEDLARAGKPAAGGTARAHASLDDQVGRALNTVRSLAGIGGALGAAEGFDAGAAIEDLLALVARWARGRSLRLEREIAGGLPGAAGDPALFLCLAHRLLGRCAATRRPGGTILVRVERGGGGVAVRLLPAGGPEAGAAAADDGIDHELARRLGAQLQFETGGAATIALAAAR
jgi:signal transduction histidine kinase